jgi:cystatin-A/B
MSLPHGPRIAGGIGQTKSATPEVQSMVDGLKMEVSSKLGGKNLHPFKAVSFKTQVVAGTNYFVKIHAGDEHIHVRMFRPLGENSTPQLHSCQAGHSSKSEIEYF